MSIGRVGAVRVMRVSPRGDARSVDREVCRLGIEPRKDTTSVPTPSGVRKATPGGSSSREPLGPRVVLDPTHACQDLAREPGEPVPSHAWLRGTPWEV